MPSENYIYFGLFGDFDPDELSREIDLEATESSAKGSKNAEEIIPRYSSIQYGLTYAAETKESLDVYELADQVIEKLEPYTSQFQKVIKKYNAEAVLEVVFWFSTNEDKSTPALGFNKKVIQFLANTNATIDMDSYLD